MECFVFPSATQTRKNEAIPNGTFAFCLSRIEGTQAGGCLTTMDGWPCLADVHFEGWNAS